jgi:hypothetical protein
MKPKYKRVILKISGEALAGDQSFGLKEEMVQAVARQVKAVYDMGVEVAIVVGGATFGEEEPVPVWTAQQRIIWVCWQPSSTQWLYRTL